MVAAKEPANKRLLPLFTLRQSLAFCLLLLTIMVTLFSPSAFYILLWLPLMAILMALPLIKPLSRLHSLIFASWVVLMFALAFAKWQFADSLSSILIMIVILTAVVSTMLIFLFDWRKRYNQMLKQVESSAQEKPEMNPAPLAADEQLTKVDSRVVQQMHLLNELEERTEHLTLLNQIGQVLSDRPTQLEAQARISKLVTELFSDTSGALCVRNRDSNSIRTIATWGDLSVEPQFLEDDCYALRHGEAHLFSCQKNEATFCNHLHYTGMSEYLCVPLKVPGQTLGVLHLHAQANETLSMGIRKRAEMAAEQIALVLANLKLREHLRLKAIRDPLTRLYNREYMEESLDHKLKEMDKNKRPMGIMMLAVNQLQEFAKLFGYEKGEELLRELGIFVQSVIRSKDLACRYSEDQFVLMLPGASLEVTKQRAEQLCKGIEQLKLEKKYDSHGIVTLSLGVVSYPQHGQDKKSLLHVAKQALGEAQAAGVSRVIVG